MPDSPDTELHAALVAYTSHEPPQNFTYDQVLTAGRRARRLRRFAVAGAGTAVAAVATSLAVVTLPHAGTTTPPTPYTVAGPSWTTLDPAPYCETATKPYTGPAVPLRPKTVVNEKNGYRIRIPAEPAERAADRISCYLAGAVPSLLPGAVFHRDPATPADTIALQAYPSRVFDPDRPADTTPPTISASAVITDDQGVGDIGFGVSSTSETTTAAIGNCAAPPCSVRTGPHGETVIVLDTLNDSGYRLVNVYVYRGDTTTFASASNGLPDAAAPSASGAVSTEGEKAGRKDLPLTVDQLIDLAAAPPMAFFH